MALTEYWRPVVGWDGLYEVSSDGCVRSLDRLIPDPRPCSRTGNRVWRGHIMRQDSRVYPMVTLYRDGTRARFKVHHLVLLAFVGPKPFPSAVCRHLDGNRYNNGHLNLAWGTAQENNQDTVRHGTWRNDHRPNGLTP